jgi:restriction endonuclease Mrr
MFRRVVKISRLQTLEELEGTCELYKTATPRELERRIRSLNGIEFETFLATVLSRLPDFREIKTTRQSHDDGVDLEGLYVPSVRGPQFALIGQAKQTSQPISASQARDFVGALNISEKRSKVGLYVSTSGFTAPARETLRKCTDSIMCWGMEELIEHSQDIATRRVDLSFGVPDVTFWDEVLGRT